MNGPQNPILILKTPTLSFCGFLTAPDLVRSQKSHAYLKVRLPGGKQHSNVASPSTFLVDAAIARGCSCASLRLSEICSWRMIGEACCMLLSARFSTSHDGNVEYKGHWTLNPETAKAWRSTLSACHNSTLQKKHAVNMRAYLIYILQSLHILTSVICLYFVNICVQAYIYSRIYPSNLSIYLFAYLSCF